MIFLAVLRTSVSIIRPDTPITCTTVSGVHSIHITLNTVQRHCTMAPILPWSLTRIALIFHSIVPESSEKYQRYQISSTSLFYNSVCRHLIDTAVKVFNTVKQSSSLKLNICIDFSDRNQSLNESSFLHSYRSIASGLFVNISDLQIKLNINRNQ